MNEFCDAAELFARKCRCGTLQAEVLLERLAVLLNAGVHPESILATLETHPAAANHPGDQNARARILAAGVVQYGPSS